MAEVTQTENQKLASHEIKNGQQPSEIAKKYGEASFSGKTLLAISNYRDRNRLTPFFSLAQAADLRSDVEVLLRQDLTEASENDVLTAKAASLAVGAELARQLNEPKQIRHAKEDGRAGFDQITGPYNAILKIVGELKNEHPDILLNEYRRATARSRGLGQDHQIPEEEALDFEGVMLRAQQIIARKAQALAGYSSR